MNKLLEILDDQNLLAACVDSDFNIISVGSSLEEFLFFKNIISSQKLSQLFTKDEVQQLKKLVAESEEEVVSFNHNFERFNSQVIGLRLYKDENNFVVVFESLSEDDRNRDEKNIDNLLDSFKRLVFINKVGFIQINNEGTIVDHISNGLDAFIEKPSKGIHFKECFEKDLVKKIKKSISKKSNRKKIDIFEFSLDEVDSSKWYLFELSQISSGCIIVIKDITQEKQKMRAEVESDRLTTLGILAGGLAHQFNNIHHVILGNLDLINYIETQEQLDDCLDTVRRSVDKASNLTQKLLSFSRRKKEHIEPYSVEALLKTSYEFTEEKFLKSNIDFSIEKKCPGPFIAQLDSALFEQVLINLIINSIQAMNNTKKNNFIKVRLDKSKDGEQIFCDIVDSGCGVKIENIDKIFTPLFTTKGVSRSSSSVERGTGLGLSLSKKLISDMSGDLQLVETSTKGSTFRITLKKAPAQQLDIFSKQKKSLGLNSDSNVRVVVFDDQKETRDYLRKYFSSLRPSASVFNIEIVSLKMVM